MATTQEVAAFIAKEFPEANCEIREVGPGQSTVFQSVGPGELRPGGTVSGPVLMSLADVALYTALLGQIGIVPLAVTTNLNISFLRKPTAEQGVVARCQMLKVGRSLAMGEVYLYSEGSAEPVAHATGTYAIPPDRES